MIYTRLSTKFVDKFKGRCNFMDKVKKKKKSLSSQIKRLKERIKELDKGNDRLWILYKKYEYMTEELEKLILKKYFKIKFKIKCNAGHEVEAEEMIESYTLRLAIKKLLEKRTYPNSFKLVDVKIFG